MSAVPGNMMQSDLAWLAPALLGSSPGMGELLLIFTVALLLFGSKKLPGLARSLGRALEEFRRAARQVSGEILREDEPPAPPRSVEPDDTPAKKDEPDEGGA